MKNTKEEKQKLRRYLDDIYTRNEASQLLDSLRDAENKDLLEEVTAEVWEASADHGRTTRAEREEYKKEARQLLQSLEHGKRIWFRRSAYAIASIAALLCLVFGSIHYYHYTNEQNTTYTLANTSYGEKKQVTLPDGTQLVLNSCSSLRYPSRFNGKERKVELEGEAYFRVAHNEDMPFIVTTRNFNVLVLGTHFNIKSYPKDEIVSVNVESGKVQVDLPEAMMRLTAREQVLINTLSGEYAKKKEEREVAVWIKGGLRFSSTPIRDVARELERVYNCRITFAPEYEFTNLISGEHDNKSLESVLQSIEYVSGVKHKKEGKEIVLYK